MKTIADLNNKWWYRLIKVIFIVVFIAVEIGAADSVYQNFKPYEEADYLVSCNYGNKAEFIAYKDREIFISIYDFDANGNLEPDYLREKIKNACGISKVEMNKIIDGVVKKIKAGEDAPTIKLFEIKVTTYTKNSWVGLAAFLLMSAIAAAGIFEFIRQVFYYVVLGSFRPNNK